MYGRKTIAVAVGAVLVLAAAFLFLTLTAASNYGRTTEALDQLVFDVTSLQVGPDGAQVEFAITNAGRDAIYLESLVLSLYRGGDFAFSLPNIMVGRFLQRSETLPMSGAVPTPAAGFPAGEGALWRARGTAWVQVGPARMNMPVRLFWEGTHD